MKKITFAFVWVISFVLLLLVGDQFLIRYPGNDTPMLKDFQTFYRDFRHRLLAIETNQARQTSQPKSVQDVIVRQENNSRKITTQSVHNQAARYVYVDEHGTLNFVDGLQNVPAMLRHTAKKLDQ